MAAPGEAAAAAKVAGEGWALAAPMAAEAARQVVAVKGAVARLGARAVARAEAAEGFGQAGRAAVLADGVVAEWVARAV